MSTLPPRAVSLALWEAVAFSLLVLRRLLRCWSLPSSSFLSGLPSWSLPSETLCFSEGVCALAGVYWCVDGDFTIFCSCGSCMWSAASSSSLGALPGDFSFLEGIVRLLDGVLAFAFVLGLLSRQQLQRWCTTQQLHCDCEGFPFP